MNVNVFELFYIKVGQLVHLYSLYSLTHERKVKCTIKLFRLAIDMPRYIFPLLMPNKQFAFFFLCNSFARKKRIHGVKALNVEQDALIFLIIIDNLSIVQYLQNFQSVAEALNAKSDLKHGEHDALICFYYFTFNVFTGIHWGHNVWVLCQEHFAIFLFLKFPLVCADSSTQSRYLIWTFWQQVFLPGKEPALNIKKKKRNTESVP